MNEAQMYKILELILRKIICYRNKDGSYSIFSHDEENTERVINEVMGILKSLIAITPTNK